MISVCVATYNGEDFLREQIDSILTNLPEDAEVVISDDGSTDGTLAILGEYAETDSRVIVINGPGHGVIKNFENAISHSRGDYIFLSDQDDIWASDKVDTVMKAFNESDCLLVMHDAVLVDSDNHGIGETLYGLRGSRSGFLKNLGKNSFVGCCMAFRATLIGTILPIPADVEMHDWWIGLVAETKGKTCFIPNRLIRYRRHGRNVSGMNHYPIPKMVANRLRLIVELLARKAVRGNAY